MPLRGKNLGEWPNGDDNVHAILTEIVEHRLDLALLAKRKLLAADDNARCVGGSNPSDLVLPLAIVHHLVRVLEWQTQQRPSNTVGGEPTLWRPVVDPLAQNLLTVRPDRILKAGRAGLVRSDVQKTSSRDERWDLIGGHDAGG